MISLRDLDTELITALPELASDRAEYDRRQRSDPEFSQSFFGYSFVPSLQVALDRNLDDFCQRAFTLIERLVGDGDADVQALLREEFFAYGPACEKWMKRAEPRMGPLTRKAASGEQRSSL